MGKDSLLKSTSNETAKKAKKKTAAKKSAAKKKTAAKKSAAKKKTATKKSVKAKSNVNTTHKPKKKFSVKELVMKKFDCYKPEKLFTVSEDEKTKENFSAPPFVPDSDQEKAKLIKDLLLRKYDIKEIRAAGEKAAAEKKAAEKAKAEKETAEKAAAEKAKAEKEAAEKAAAEKRAAAKAALEEEAAKKAEEEKAANLRAAEEKIAAEQKAEADQAKKTIITLAACFILVFAPVLATCISNSGKYYIKEYKGEVEIWQGKFAPIGSEQIVVMDGMKAPEKVKEVYSKNEVYHIIFNYYLNRSTHRANYAELPDFKSLKSDLSKAMAYASNKQDREIVKKRLAKIDLAAIIYKIDSTAHKGSTPEDLKAAKKYLRKAKGLYLDKNDALMLENKISSIDKLIEDANSYKKGVEKEAQSKK